MESAECEPCSIRLCPKPAVDKSPITCQSVCQQHMQADVSDLQASESAVAERLAYFKKYVRPLRLMQQRLAFDLQHLDDNFLNLREALDDCQRDLFNALTRHNDQLLENLQIVADIDEFESELKAAKQRDDTREAFLLNKSMGRSLETLKLDSKLVCMDANAQQVEMAAFPDVNSRIRELQTCVERHLVMTRKLVELLDVSDVEQTRLRLDKTQKEIDASGKPLGMAVCSNTRSYVVDNSGKIAKVQDAPDGLVLPQPNIFVAVESPVTPPVEDSTDEATTRMPQCSVRLICPDSQVSAPLECSWDADLPIIDLHCDSALQLLFIAQKNLVTVTDLSGALHSKIPVSELQDSAEELCCITGDSDKLYVLTKLSDGRPVAFGLSKESRKVQMTLHVPETCNLVLDSCTRIAVRDGMLMISDNGGVFTVCTVTGLRVHSESMDSPDILGDSDTEDDGKDIAEHLLFSDCQPGPRIAQLKTVWNAVTEQILLMERSSNHCVFVVLKAGKLFLNTLKICRR